jgi:hypothetical protein
MMNITTADAYTTRITRALTTGERAAVQPHVEASPLQLRDILQSLNVSPKDAANLELYHRASEESGGKVIMDQRHGYLPVLIGSDDNLIPLYKFVEVIDEITDYEHIKQEFPTLSFGQIASAIGFLRKLVQFNTRNIDIDAIEDTFLAEDPDFQAAIRASLEDQEDLRVRTLE